MKILSFLASLHFLFIILLTGDCYLSKSFRQLPPNIFQGLSETNLKIAHGWIPLSVTDDMNNDFPKTIPILGETYILWKNQRKDLSEQDWIVTKQLSHTDSSDVTTFPIHTTQDLLWAYLPLHGFNDSFPELPERLLPELNSPDRVTVTRDLPYSFDFTIENFMDPAHIPFAHHSFQGTRDDAGPMPMEILTDLMNNKTHCEVIYREKSKSKERQGIVSFISPIYYNLRIFNQNRTVFFRPLIIIVVPIAPGKTRIFLSAISPKTIVSRFIPKWWIHAFYLRFLDSDIWIHDQEKLIRYGLSSFSSPGHTNTFNDYLLGKRPSSRLLPKYTLMTQSDRGCIAWRKWWKHHMEHIPLFGPMKQEDFRPLSNEMKRERYSSHTSKCRHCMRALAIARITHNLFNPTIVYLSFIAIKNKYVLALLLGVSFLVNKIVEYVEKELAGPDPWVRTSAAQF